MALTSDNSQFARGKGTGLNFAGTNFAADSSIDGPDIKGNGVDGKNSSWIATIYSKKVLKYFRTASVVEAITNNDYYGEISNYGDSVIIIKEPKMNIVDYGRGQKLTSQAIDSDSMTLVLDQAKAFQFQVDDIEEKLSHVNWQSLATDAASYDLKNNYDKSILNWMAEQVVPANIITTEAGEAVAVAASGSVDALKKIAAAKANVLQLVSKEADADFVTKMTPLDLLNRFNLKLDIAEVPEEGRWVVVDPAFLELAMRMDSNLMNRDYNDGAATIRNGLVSVSPIRGLKMYKTNNAPKLVAVAYNPVNQTGTPGVSVSRPNTDAKLNDEGRIILAGHMSAVATANAIVKTESFRSHESFGDVVRGMHVYGRGVVRPESLVAATVTYRAPKA
ncbi:p22 coat protein [Vibrio phage CHOED]|uniref:p22 coat protein n=1 Tax=Vibrio phage CHOED TaxID=1458716 RepID=UPI00042F25F3|nr:p22 coat protein [Vibrio phage CHOED]AHK11952.1 p22 coat protein [Vibrio phage CHOED]